MSPNSQTQTQKPTPTQASPKPLHTQSKDNQAKPRAIVLLSGGLDSATCLAWASQRFECTALCFDYGQRHVSEMISAGRLASSFDVPLQTIRLGLGELGGSALTDHSIELPQSGEPSDDIPVTYVPARNTLFLSYALALAEVRGASNIVIGVNAVDYSGYPDCRPEFIQAFEHMANLATRAQVEGGKLQILTPLIELSKSQIIKLGVELGVDYAKTVSCYQADEDGRACGQCDSCVLRRRGFDGAGVVDPTRYV